jgi:hypothetical protein
VTLGLPNFMSKLRPHVDRLAAATQWAYRASHESAAEAAAWSALALVAHDQLKAALAPATWLAELQQEDGSVGVSAAEAEPRWPTSLALLAWCIVERATDCGRFSDCIDRAAGWSLADRGKTAPRSSKIGHDTTLAGWSWAADTSSWLEPTCYHVLGLAAAGYDDHPRVQEGVRLIADRLLPAGGANYGNTIVLGQPLVAHIAPTGVALVALAGRGMDDDRIEASLRFLEQAAGDRTTPMSLSWACMGLAAHGRSPELAGDWIEHALQEKAWQYLSEFELALLLLAAEPRILGHPAGSTSDSKLSSSRV